MSLVLLEVLIIQILFLTLVVPHIIIKENILPMEESGRLKFVELESASPFSQLDILFVSGHTDKMMIPKIKYKDKIICFVSRI